MIIRWLYISLKGKYLKMNKYKNVVLGAGISGLAYANAIGKDKTIIIEKNGYYGGLCHSFNVNGFTFDSAVHLSFTNDETVRKEFDKVEFWKHKPISYNYYSDKWIKHPIINNLYKLDTEEKVNFIKSYFNRRENCIIKSYRDWLLASYGEEFTKKLYDVYTEKYWTVKSENLSTEWIGNRLASTSADKILYGAFSTNDDIDYYVNEMRYPKCGGYQHFIDHLSDNCNIVYGSQVTEVDLDNKTVMSDDGKIYEYDNLASSIPLNELVKITKNIPNQLLEESKKLTCTKVSLVSVGFSRPDVAKWLWFYIYDKEIMAARVNSPSMKSPDNAPIGKSSLQFEIYHNDNDVIDRDEIINNVRESILKMKLCKESDILFMDYKLLEYANVIFTIDMCGAREKIRKYYMDKGIDLIGRFGEFEYYWSDQSFMSGWNKGYNRKVEGK